MSFVSVTPQFAQGLFVADHACERSSSALHTSSGDEIKSNASQASSCPDATPRMSTRPRKSGLDVKSTRARVSPLGTVTVVGSCRAPSGSDRSRTSTPGAGAGHDTSAKKLPAAPQMIMTTAAISPTCDQSWPPASARPRSVHRLMMKGRKKIAKPRNMR